MLTRATGAYKTLCVCWYPPPPLPLYVPRAENFGPYSLRHPKVATADQSMPTKIARVNAHKSLTVLSAPFPVSPHDLPPIQILVAMLCVFGTGWPFVGVIFVPMLLNCAWLRLRRGTSFAEGLGAATASATWALICAAAVAGLATWVDSEWYGRTTSPTLNIL